MFLDISVGRNGCLRRPSPQVLTEAWGWLDDWLVGECSRLTLFMRTLPFSIINALVCFLCIASTAPVVSAQPDAQVVFASVRESVIVGHEI